MEFHVPIRAENGAQLTKNGLYFVEIIKVDVRALAIHELLA